MSNTLLHVSPAGEIELRLNADRPIGADELEQLKGLGVRVVAELTIENRSVLQAWVKYDKVEAVAEFPWVMAVLPPDYGVPSPHPANPFNSEGVGVHHADQAHAVGVNGGGVTVGAISDGFNTPGDTPTVAVAPGCIGTGFSTGRSCSPIPGHRDLGCFTGDTCTGTATGVRNEGTAMLEIVHDMAPGAYLQFAEGLSGAITHTVALLNLAAGTGLPAPSDVITEDIAFFLEPVFEQGLVARVGDLVSLGSCDSISSFGVPFNPCAPTSLHSAAGNQARVHWRSGPTGGFPPTTPAVFDGPPDGVVGPYENCPFLPSNPTAMDFADGGGNTTLDIFGFGGDVVFLQWSEPFAGAFTDLDLYLMDTPLTSCFAVSINQQGGGAGMAAEFLFVPFTGTFKVVVNLFGSIGAAGLPVVDLKTLGRGFFRDAPVSVASITGDSNYLSLASPVGAVNAALPSIVESFSSWGPITLGFTTPPTGFAVDPSGVTPAFVGAAGVTISGAGGFGSGRCPATLPGQCRFFGTSAASPHAAGCDALVRQGLGGAPPVELVNARLHSTAIDIAQPGPDNVSGAGKLDCFAAAVTQVAVDINPRTDPNAINLRSRGVIPVAILGSEDFDVADVDVTSVEFGPGGATEDHRRGHFTDVDKDGDTDLLLHFRTQETGIQCGDTTASLRGRTLGGQVFTGLDSIRIRRCE